MTRILTAIALLCVMGASWSHAIVAAGDVQVLAVIVHSGVPVQTLNAADLRSIYRRETTYWPDGQPIRPLALLAESTLRHQFDLAVLGLDPEGVGKYWIDQRVRGIAVPARMVSSPELVARVVTALPGSIAYVPASLVPAGARVVAVVREGSVRTADGAWRHLAEASPEVESKR